MTLTARDIAVKALRDRSGYVSDHLDRLLAESSLGPADRGLASELTLGVLRRRRTLQCVLRKYLRRPRQKLPRPIEAILHVAIYQLMMLDRVPDFAAVDQAVEQTRRFGHPRQAGLVNGLLRTFLRELGPADASLAAPAANVVPTPAGGRTLPREVFRDPQHRPADYLGEAYSLPSDLTARWIDAHGFETARALAIHSCATPPVICRVNLARSTVTDVLASLAAESIDAVAHENGCSVVLPSAGGLADCRAFRDGLIQPQDPTATAVIAQADVAPGMAVLDFCAAPGTKTTHLAQRMNNLGRIDACDVNDEKLARIDDNCRRMGIDIVRTIAAGQIGQLDLASYDLVLVDVPCSNTGVLARRIEARWRFTADEPARIADDQFFLLNAAAHYVRPGGTLLYSTCSIEPEEDTRIVERLLGKIENLTCRDRKLTLPGGAENPVGWHDGGFRAIFDVR